MDFAPGKIHMERGKPNKYRGLKQPKPQEESFYLPTLNDIKSQLPNYDEVTAFAQHHGRDEKSKQLFAAGTMPKPGRSIKKLNIEDLPMKYSADVLPSVESLRTGKVKAPRSRGKLEEYNLMSKFDSTVFNIDSKLAQATAKKLQTDLNNKRQLKAISTKKDIFKLSTNVLEGIESELGFGFRADIMNPSRRSAAAAPKTPNPSQIVMKMAAKKTEASIQAIKKQINSKKEERKDEQQFGWDGYPYHEPLAHEILGASKGLEMKVQGPTVPSRSRFRHSINAIPDMERSINRSPRDGASSSRRRSDGGRLEGQDPGGKSSILTRQSALYIPKERKVEKLVKARSKESAGIMTLQTLLDTQSLTSTIDINNNSDDSGSEPSGTGSSLKRFDFGELKQATSTLAKSLSRARVKGDAAHTLRPRSPGVGTMPESFHDQVQVPSASGREMMVQPQDFIKERLGESVKNVDDAATIASRLGSLMARVALCKKGPDGTTATTKSGGTVDTVNLARELRELASSMEKDYGKTEAAGVQTSSSGTVETQTEGKEQAARNNQQTIPQPHFTKQMSYTDQLVLRKLREVRQSWAQGVQELQSPQTTTNAGNV